MHNPNDSKDKFTLRNPMTCVPNRIEITFLKDLPTAEISLDKSRKDKNQDVKPQV